MKIEPSVSTSVHKSVHSSLRVPASLMGIGAAPPSISGTAYPGETLTVTGGSGSIQWTVDGTDVSGETASTYVVRVNDIGVEIACVVGAETTDVVVSWHPNDEPGVSLVSLANKYAFNTVGPYIEATDGQSVVSWNDNSPNSYNFTQATEASKPIRQVAEQSGNDILRFNGTAHQMTNVNNDIGRNKSIIYMGLAISDTNRTAGGASHGACIISTAANAATARFAIYTRLGSSNIYDLVVRRLDADSLLQVSTASLAGFNVLLGEGLYASSTANLRVNGSQVATGATSSGSTSDTASAAISIGGDGTNFLPGDIAGLIIATPGSAWTASERSRIERYLGLLVGKDIPLV